MESMLLGLSKLQGLIVDFGREEFFLEGEFSAFLEALMKCKWLNFFDLKVNLENQKDLGHIFHLLESDFFMSLSHYNVELTGIRSRQMYMKENFIEKYKIKRSSEYLRRFILE